MEGHELLDRARRVKAPSDFEARVVARLGEARRTRERKRAVLRYAFAGSAAVVLVGFVLVNQLGLRREGAPSYAGRGKGKPAAVEVSYSPAAGDSGRAVLPVMETADYSNEFRNASNQPRTVYILEQVSEVRPSEIKF